MEGGKLSLDWRSALNACNIVNPIEGPFWPNAVVKGSDVKVDSITGSAED